MVIIECMGCNNGEMILDTENFRKTLLARIQEIRSISATGDAAAGVVELDQTRVGRVSRMDALQSQAMSQEAKRRREIELARIEQALKRLESGDYGYCVSCGDEIGVKRLDLDPSNPFCINCAK